MALQALLPYLPTAISAVGSIFSGGEDPDEYKREELKKLIAELKGQFPKMAAALRTREGVERGGLMRRISDVGAAGGMPREATMQRMVQGSMGSQRNLNEALAGLDEQKLRTLQNIGGMIQGMPQEQTGFPWEQLLSVSLYDLIGGGPLSTGLGNLGGGQGTGGGPGLMEGFKNLKLETFQPNLPKASGRLPMLR